MMMIVVFDFDKTLTQKDTLDGFYKSVNKSGTIYKVKRILLFAAAVCFKLNIIANSRLKEIGVYLFLKGKDKYYIDECAKLYASTIGLNNIYYDEYLDYSKDDRIIVSASLMEYLRPLFPGEKLHSSSLKYSESMKVIGLDENLYAEQKRIALSKVGIERIDILYTDSYSDIALMKISNKVFLVKDGVKKLIKN